MATFEMNNVRKDSDMMVNPELKQHSPVVEVFSAMVKGESLDRFGKKADTAVEYIKNLGVRADNGDYNAVAELNTIRRFVVESPLMEEIKSLSIFGSYKHVGYDESIEREVYTVVGERSREQASNGDVVFPITKKETYPVPTITISGGYAVDYRKVALGDMSKETEGINQVKIDILNKAKLAIVKKIYTAVKNATGITYMFEAAGLTKTGVDDVLTKVRRYGRPTIVGDYAVLSQFTPWAGYVGNIGGQVITGLSQNAMNEIAKNGLLSMYNGAILQELENPYNEYQLNDTGDNYEPLFPAGLALVIPAGAKSPVATWTRGGLTTFSGNDIKTGQILSRFDMEIAVDVAKGQENHIGLIYDTNVGGIN